MTADRQCDHFIMASICIACAVVAAIVILVLFWVSV